MADRDILKRIYMLYMLRSEVSDSGSLCTKSSVVLRGKGCWLNKRGKKFTQEQTSKETNEKACDESVVKRARNQSKGIESEVQRKSAASCSETPNLARAVAVSWLLYCMPMSQKHRGHWWSGTGGNFR